MSHQGSASSLLSDASSLHLPLDDTPRTLASQHVRRSSMPKQTPNQVYVKSLQASPYLAGGQGRKKMHPLKPSSSAGSRRPGFPPRLPTGLSQSRGADKATHHTRSLSAGRAVATATGGVKVASHKNRDDLLEELMEVRKIGRTHLHERNLLAGRVRHLEEEVAKKDKRIASFLESGYLERHEAVRSRGASVSKGEGMTMLGVLKRKVHTLETNLRQKESELAQLKMDVKITSLDELQIKVDTYYEEVLRLRQVISKKDTLQQNSTKAEQASQQIKALSASLQRVADRNEELRQENEQLEKKLKSAEALSSSSRTLHSRSSKQAAGGYHDSNSRKRMKSAEDRFADSSRQDMTSHITQLETRNEELTKALQQAHQEHLVTLKELKTAKQNQQDQDECHSKVTDLEEQCEKLHSVVRRLKEDRTHYHKLAEERKQLAKQQASKISELGKREKTLAGNLKESESRHQQEATARQHARELERRKANPRVQFGSDGRSAKQQTAAVAIQRKWKAHKSKRRQERLEADTDQAITGIQAALRGQISRSRYLASGQQETTTSDEEESDVND